MLVVLVNSKGVDLPINNMQFDKVLLQPPCLGQKYNLQYSATLTAHHFHENSHSKF